MKSKNEKELINKIIDSDKIKWTKESDLFYGRFELDEEHGYEFNLQTEDSILKLKIFDNNGIVISINNSNELTKLIKNVQLKCDNRQQENINKLIELL